MLNMHLFHIMDWNKSGLCPLGITWETPWSILGLHWSCPWPPKLQSKHLLLYEIQLKEKSLGSILEELQSRRCMAMVRQHAGSPAASQLHGGSWGRVSASLLVALGLLCGLYGSLPIREKGE